MSGKIQYEMETWQVSTRQLMAVNGCQRRKSMILHVSKGDSQLRARGQKAHHSLLAASSSSTVCEVFNSGLKQHRVLRRFPFSWLHEL